MKLLKIIIIIFLALTIEINADTEKEIINNLQKGGNLIFIRHAMHQVMVIQKTLISIIVRRKEI